MEHQDNKPEPSSDMLARLGAFFSARGASVYLVGGYLRDSLISIPPENDVDIALPGDPEPLGRELARAFKGTYVPLSRTHGVGRVVIGGSDSGLPRPSRADQDGGWTIDLTGFSGSIEEDLARRDFTINTLALPLEHWASLEHLASLVPEEMVIDPYNGRQDLARKCIRAVSPHVFEDDPGRLLRVVRLAARLRFRLDPETIRLVVASAAGISQVSGERVRDELLALLAMDGARGHLEVLDRLDLLCRIIPELAETKGVEQPKEHYWDVWGHLMHSVECAELVIKGHQNSAIYSLVPWTLDMESYFAQQISDGHTRGTVLKLTALLHDIAKPQTKKKDETGRTRFLGHSELGATMAETRLAQLRFSSKGIATVARIITEHLRPTTMRQGVEAPTSRAVYRYFRDLGDVAIDTLYHCLADYLAAKGPEVAMDDWVAHTRMVGHILQVGTQPPASGTIDRLVTGHDLMKHFHMSPGPLVGMLLERINEAQASGEVASREEAIALAENTLKSHTEASVG